MKASAVKRVIPTIAVSILVLATSLPTAALPRHYIYTDLGIAMPYASQRSVSINDAGQIVGGRSAPEKAFRWEQGTGAFDLGALSGGRSNPYGINSAGVVVGQSTDSTNVYHPFIWRPGAGMTDLGTLGGLTGAASDINDSEQVVGGSSDASNNRRAFIWQQGSGMKALGMLGGLFNEAWAINNSGKTVGIEQMATGDNKGWHTKAFVWDSAEGMRELPGIGGNRNGAYNINELGQAVGFAESAARTKHAAVWPDLAHALDLGALNGPQGTSIGRGINDLGQVVGYSTNSTGTVSAFAWDQGTGMVDLNTKLVNRPANTWLMDASSINDNGWIVGMASTSNYQYRLYLLMPTSPEPEGLIVLGTGLVSLTAGLRRRRGSWRP